jgi:hypothetical protein
MHLFGFPGMNADCNLEPHLAALMFLGTALLLAACTVSMMVMASMKKWQAVTRTAMVMCFTVGTYAVALLGLSLVSGEKVLAAGEQKYLCELDCHTAYSIAEVRMLPAIGAGPEAVRPEGVFYVLTLRTWFDPATTSPQRPKDAPLTPNPRTVVLLDPIGRTYQRSPVAEQRLAQAGQESTPLTHPLLPGESYTTTLVFDVPSDITGAKLLIEQAGVPPLILGQETSLFHGKTYLALPR